MLLMYPFRFFCANINRLCARVSAPFLINYCVTHCCNMQCSFCGRPLTGTTSPKTDELTAHDIRKFLRDPLLRHLDVIVISGGEPYVKEDLDEILLTFQKVVSPFTFHITTNGYFTDRIVDSITVLKQKGLSVDLKVSIDAIGEHHDALRQYQGSYTRAVTTIENLRRRFSRKELYIGINQTISNSNYQFIDGVCALAKAFDTDYRGFIALKQRTSHEEGKRCDYGLVSLNEEAKRIIYERLSAIYFKKRYQLNPSELFEKMVIHHYLRGQLRMLEGKRPYHRCMNLFTHFRLEPNGDVVTCSYDQDVLGNSKDECYSDIIKKKSFKNKLKKVKACGLCWLGCEVTPNWFSSLCLTA